jgi:hypothetical protein
MWELRNVAAWRRCRRTVEPNIVTRAPLEMVKGVVSYFARQFDFSISTSPSIRRIRADGVICREPTRHADANIGRPAEVGFAIDSDRHSAHSHRHFRASRASMNCTECDGPAGPRVRSALTEEMGPPTSWHRCWPQWPGRWAQEPRPKRGLR